MLNISYYTGVRLYRLGISIAKTLGNEKAKQWVEGRKGWKKELLTFREKHKDKPLIWFHASSLGEFEQVKPLIERIKKSSEYKEYLLFVTFFSPSGFENSKNYTVADKMMYLPLDTEKNASFFVETLQPDLAIFVKYDFWFNYLNKLQESLIPILYFSCNFRENQIYFKSYARWQRSILEDIDKIFTINEKSNQVLLNKRFTNSAVCGDTRYDKVIQNAEQSKDIPIIKKFKQTYPLLVLGSSWQPEEKIIAQYLEKQKGKLKIIIAPHDISEKHLKEIEKIIPVPMLRYSQLLEDNVNNVDVILVDNIGLLSNMYQYADFAFIGGGFTNDLHNILEAAAFGNVVFYGNKFSKFPEGQELIDFGGGISIGSYSEFEEKFNTILNDKKLQKEMQQKAKAFVYRHKGATDIVFKAVKELLF